MNYKLFCDNINDYFDNVKPRSWTENPADCKQQQVLNTSVSNHKIQMSTDSDLEKRMQNRVKIMRHGCKYLDKIDKLMTSEKTNMNQLLKFHKSIYDLKQPFESKIMKRKQCRIALKNISSIKLGMISKTLFLFLSWKFLKSD